MASAWFEPVMAYCERLDGGFWAEPLNAVSNGAFLIAALPAAVAAARAGDRPALGLAGLTAVVGLGSFLFHTLANRWSLLADVIPIGVFIYAYFLLALVRFLGLRPTRAVPATLAFAGLNVGFGPALDALTGTRSAFWSNGSIDYLPALLALVATGSLIRWRDGGDPGRRAARGLFGAAALFLVSLVFRTIDRAVCPGLPTGTHALWHLLNAVVLYRLIRTAVRFREQASGLSASR